MLGNFHSNILDERLKTKSYPGQLLFFVMFSTIVTVLLYDWKVFFFLLNNVQPRAKHMVNN